MGVEGGGGEVEVLLLGVQQEGEGVGPVGQGEGGGGELEGGQPGVGGGTQTSPPHRQVGRDGRSGGVHRELVHLEHLGGDGQLGGQGGEEGRGQVDRSVLVVQVLLGGGDVPLLGGELQQVPVAVLKLPRQSGRTDRGNQGDRGAHDQKTVWHLLFLKRFSINF